MNSPETTTALTPDDLKTEHDTLVDMLAQDGNELSPADTAAFNELVKFNRGQFAEINRKGASIAISETLGVSPLPVAERQREAFDAAHFGNQQDSWHNTAKN